MLIEDEFRVNVPVEEAWTVLLDLERIAPCMPGAQLQEVEGDEYRGTVKVKVGPITAQYKGAARLTEVDEAARRAVIRAEGRDTRGQGNASATITAELTPDSDATVVRIESDVTITGKVAQFGRGVIADVSTKLLGQFVENLERDVLTGPAADESAAAPAPAGGGQIVEQASEIAGPAPAATPPATATPATSSGPRKIDSPEAEPVDLLGTAGTPVLKRLAPVAVVLVLLVVVLRLRSRRRRRSRA
jgi:carbon monoxide dehydrogenase subunit G